MATFAQDLRRAARRNPGYNRDMTDLPPDDRRRSQRFDLSAAVTMHVGGGGRTVLGRTTNVSKSGLFVMTREHVSEGQRVELMLVPDNKTEVIFVTGIVVHLVPGYGVGVRFSALSVRADGRLAALLKQLQTAAA